MSTYLDTHLVLGLRQSPVDTVSWEHGTHNLVHNMDFKANIQVPVR